MNRTNYGIDAPQVALRFFALGIAGVIIGAGSIFLSKQGLLPWARFLVYPGLMFGGSYLLTASVMLWGSKAGKLRLRDKVIAAISWRGDEQVLDVGCGHGLMLIAAAKRLRTGKAVGIDLWQPADQSGNSRDSTLHNVQLEGVADRVELLDGDARKLPFADDSFDVVLSSWALHNIYDPAGRAAAIREIIRVLKPGGRLAIVDIQRTKEYAQILRAGGMAGIQMRGPNFLFVIPTFTLSATKVSP
jgi:arsenite methyltransferase